MPKTRSKSPEAIELLKQDHAEVQKAFKEFEKLDREDEAARLQLVRKVCDELKAHTALEEEIFYPALREAIEDEDIMAEAAVEHDSAKTLIEQLESMEPDDPNWTATFTVLGEYVRHHIKEEEGEMFPQAVKSDLDFEDLAARMEARKAELMAQIEKEHA